MAKEAKEPRTLTLLHEVLDNEYSWRIKELSNLKSIIPKEGTDMQKILLRAGITLLYAHWEGFIRKIANEYYKFVSFQTHHKIEELNTVFISILLRKKANDFRDDKRLSNHQILFDSIKKDLQKPAIFPQNENILKTSNLNFEIFEDVCVLLSIDIKLFEGKELVINEHLLTKRNKIAHGHYLGVDLAGFKETYKNVTDIMRTFKDEALNSAALKKYLA